MQLNTEKKYAPNWLEDLYGAGPYSLEENIQKTRDCAQYNLIQDIVTELGVDNAEKHPKAQERINSEIQKMRRNISESWELQKFSLNNGGDDIDIFLPIDLGKLVRKYWGFIEQQPDLLNVFKNPDQYNAYEVAEVIMQLPAEDPEVKRFHFSCMRYGFTSNIVSEIIDTPEFGVSPHLGRFIPGYRSCSDKMIMEERMKSKDRTVLYTNGVENIGQAFLERFGTKKESKYGGPPWIKDASYYLNSALSSPYTSVEDIKTQQKLFESLNTLGLSEYRELLSPAEKLIENFRMLLYPAKLDQYFDSYGGYSIFDMQHGDYKLYTLCSSHSMIDFYDEEDDPDGVNEYLHERYGASVNVEQALKDGLSDLADAKKLLETFFQKLENIGSPILTDMRKECETFFGYYDHRFLFRPRSWKGEKTYIYYRYESSVMPDYIYHFEKFQTSFKAFSAMFVFLDLVQKEGWSKTTIDSSKPTSYENAWHLRFDKSTHTPGSMTHTGEINIFAGSNASGKSFSGLKRDAYIRMAMQAFGYAPCESGNLRNPVGSILLLDRPDPENIKKNHFFADKSKHIGDPSAFMQEATSIADALMFLTHDGVVYMDEVFTTTSPEDQAALLLGVVEYIKERGGEIMIATHNEYILRYFEQTDSNLKANIMHFGTNTYQLEQGRSDSDFLTVCGRYDAPAYLIDTAQQYLDGQWSLSEIGKTSVQKVERYSAEERERMKQVSKSIMQLFPEAGPESIFKLYSQDDSIQSWMNFERSYLNRNSVQNIGAKKTRHKNMLNDKMTNDTRYYSLLTKLLLHTGFSSSQETLERQKMFAELQKISKKDCVTVFETLEFLGSFDTALARLEQANSKIGINRYLSGYGDTAEAEGLGVLLGGQKEPKESIDFGSLREIQDCLDLNTLLLGKNAPNTEELQDIIDLAVKLLSYKSLDLRKAYDSKGKQYNVIPGRALKHVLRVIPEKYIPENESEGKIMKQKEAIEAMKDKFIEQGKWNKEERPTDSELQELLARSFTHQNMVDELFRNIVPQHLSYKMIANVVDDLKSQVRVYKACLPKLSWQEIIKSEDSRVQKVIQRIQVKEKKRVEGDYDINDFGRHRPEVGGIDNPWAALYFITEFPQALEVLESKLEGVDSIYVNQSINMFHDIAKKVKNGSFEYLQYTPAKENKVSDSSTLSQLGKAENVGAIYGEFQTINSKSTGQVKMEVLGLKSIVYWSEVIKGLGFGKVRFSTKNEVKFDKLSHLNLLGDETVPNDVHIGGENGQVRVLTGPNGSGKTFHAQSIVLGIMSAMSTGFAPAKNTRLPLFDRVSYLDRVVENSDEGLSAGANEIQYWKEVWEDVEGSNIPFVLCDELFSTTSPKYQEACTVAVLDFLKQQNSLGTISTHNHDAIDALQGSGDSFPPYYFEYGATGGTIEYDRTITKGHAPSEGMEVAKRMGLSDEIIEKARKYKKLISG